jgi:cytoskeletal protein CcmA (bactofilin family)
MTWLGQKPDPEPAAAIPPATAAGPQIASHSGPGERAATAQTPTVASIGRSLHVKGELRGNEDLTIEGQVEGTIALTGYSVTIGETGQVAAQIRAKSVLVGGRVQGDIDADQRVEVSATGNLVGDIRAPRVVLADGSRFKGSIDMDAGARAQARVTEPASSKAMASPASSHEHASSHASTTKS